jgi:hypothetical protein
MTNDIMCGYPGDREATLMAYLYEDIAPADRAAFEQHLTTCARCRGELNGLVDVRAQLARWSPPDLNLAPPGRRPSFVSEMPSLQPPRARWSLAREIPRWAQIAAALVVVGVAAGLANLDVRYDGHSLSIRTGWSKSTGQGLSSGNPVSPAVDSSASRAELVAIEQRLERLERLPSELRAQVGAPSATAIARTPSVGDAELMRRVRGLVDESARRQQTELALRLAEAVRDMNLQRQADLRRIDQNLGMFQDKTGVEVLRNRQKLDYILQRVSQQPQQ